MDYRWFIFILVASAALSVWLLAWKLIIRPRWLSWFAVPFPLLLGIAAVSFQFVYWSLVWHTMDGR